jgi:hypothetical protein
MLKRIILTIALISVLPACASYQITGKKKPETVGPGKPIKEDDGIIFSMDGTPRTVKVGELVSFTGKCGPDDKHEQDGTLSWEFGDSTTDSGFDPRHSYASEGQFTVKATCEVTGKDSKSDTLVITVNNGNTNPGQNPGQNPGGCQSCDCSCTWW